MAIEKGKVLAKLLVKYKGKSVTKNFLERLADKYAAKLPDDADDTAIDDYINDRDDLVQETISETDRRVTDAVNRATKKPNEQQQQQQPGKETEQPDDNAPDWAKSLIKTVTSLSEKVDGFQSERTQQTLSQRFHADERLKGIDPKLLKGRVPTKEEDFEAFVTEAADDLKEFKKDEATGGQQDAKPRFGHDKPNFSGKQPNQGVQQNAAQKQAIENVKAFTKTLPGSKQQSTEVKQS